MESFVKSLFPSASFEDKRNIISTLSELGVDSPEDLKYLTEVDLKGKLKIIYIRKIIEAANLGFGISQDGAEEADDANQAEDANDAETKPHDERTKNLAIATGVLGSIGVAALPLAIFAAVFPPITLPIAVAAGIGAGTIAAATAGTGIATAVLVNKKKETEYAEVENGDDDIANNDVQSVHKLL